MLSTNFRSLWNLSMTIFTIGSIVWWFSITLFPFTFIYGILLKGSTPFLSHIHLFKKLWIRISMCDMNWWHDLSMNSNLFYVINVTFFSLVSYIYSLTLVFVEKNGKFLKAGNKIMQIKYQMQLHWKWISITFKFAKIKKLNFLYALWHTNWHITLDNPCQPYLWWQHILMNWFDKSKLYKTKVRKSPPVSLCKMRLGRCQRTPLGPCEFCEQKCPNSSSVFIGIWVSCLQRNQ